MNSSLRLIIWILAALIIVAAIWFFGLAPAQIDRSNNPHQTPTYKKPALHDDLLVVDLHNDFFLWHRNFLKTYDYGHSDLERLQQGNVGLQIFSAVTKVPWGQNFGENEGDSDMILPLVVAQRWPLKAWTSPLHRALYQSERLHLAANNSDGQLRVIRSGEELDQLIVDRATNKSLTGAILAIEGAQALEARVDNLDKLYDAGYRMISLSHFFDTEFGGSAHGTKKGGLTVLGRELIDGMNAKGILIDVAHSSPALFADIVAYTQAPLFASHTGVKGTCDRGRNLSDQQIRKIADSGGLIGVAFFGEAICGQKVSDIVKAIQHSVNTVGVNSVSLGSDFDGSVGTPFDSSDMAALTAALLDAGLSEEDVRKIMGGNALRVLSQVL